MNTSGCANIPDVLLYCITFLVKALPLRSVPTFIELVVGTMLTDVGFVTTAYLAIPRKRNWSSYYKWIEKGKWSWVAVGVQMARLLIRLFPQSLWHLIIDDTVILRSSKKAPGSRIHHEHSRKPNRPEFVRGQCWVSLAAVIENGLSVAAIPFLSRLMRGEGNGSKLTAAKTLLRVIKPVFDDLRVRLLLDSWYMRGVLLRAALGFVSRSSARCGKIPPSSESLCERSSGVGPGNTGRSICLRTSRNFLPPRRSCSFTVNSGRCGIAALSQKPDSWTAIWSAPSGSASKMRSVERLRSG